MLGHPTAEADLGHDWLPTTHHGGRDAHGPCPNAVLTTTSRPWPPTAALSWTEASLGGMKRTTLQARRLQQQLAAHRRQRHASHRHCCAPSPTNPFRVHFCRTAPNCVLAQDWCQNCQERPAWSRTEIGTQREAHHTQLSAGPLLRTNAARDITPRCLLPLLLVIPQELLLLRQLQVLHSFVPLLLPLQLPVPQPP